MFIREFASRRKRLHALAQSCLPPQRLAQILDNENDDRVLDAHARQIYTELLAQGWKVDRTLKVSSEWADRPIFFAFPLQYNNPGLHMDAWDELYQTGFRDIDTPNAQGTTPLMYQLTFLSEYPELPHFILQHIIWPIEKGARLDKRIPHYNGAVAHLASSWIVVESVGVLYERD